MIALKKAIILTHWKCQSEERSGMQNIESQELCKYCIRTCMIYVIGWFVGCGIALVFVPAKLVQHVAVHPSLQESAWYYIEHNLHIELLFLLGALTFDIGTFCLLAFNSLTVGIFATTIALRYGLGFLLKGLLPHGIPESLAWILIAMCSFCMGKHLRSCFFKNERNRLKAQVHPCSSRKTINAGKVYALLLISATLLIVLAGFLEAYISPWLVYNG